MATKRKTSVWKKLTLILLGLIMLVGAAGIYLKYQYKDIVKNIIKKEVDNVIIPDVYTDIDFTVLKTFPYASVVFKNTHIKDPFLKDSTILSVKRIYFKFNLMDLLQENYTLNHIELSEGEINLFTDQQGRPNYKKVFKEKQDTTQEKFSLDLKKIILSKITLNYIDKQSDAYLSMLAGEATAKGKFGNENFQLATYGNFIIHKYRSGKDNWFENDHVYADLSLRVFSENQRFLLEKGKVNFNSLQFTTRGEVITDETKSLDVHLKTDKLDIKKLISELPVNITQKLKPYSLKGNTNADIHLSGSWQGNQNPHIESAFGFHDVQMEHKKSGIKIRNLNLKGNFTNGSHNRSYTSKLSLSEFSGHFDKQKFQGKFSLTNLDKPKIDISAKTTIDVQKLKQFANLDTLEIASGLVDLQMNYSFSPEDINNLKPVDFSKGRSEGNVNLKKLNIKLKNNTNHFQNVNGLLSFNTKDVSIKNLEGSINNENDFLLNGYLKNLLPFLFFDNEELHIIADLKSHNLSLDNLLKYSSDTENNSEYKLNLPANIYCNFDVDVDKLKFRKFNAEHILGNVRLKNQILYIDDLAMQSMAGKLRMRGALNAVTPGNIKVNGKGYLEEVKIDQAFYQLENFNQQSLTHNNIFGKLTSDLTFSLRLNQDLSVQKNSFHTNANITINKGKLVNFKPLEKMSRFIRVDDLSRVSFGELKNTITVKGNQVIIPKMEIKSDAVNMKLGGKHSFDNEIEYYVEILLSEILSRKARQNKEENSEFGQIRDDGLNRTTLFLKIYGDIKNPQFAYDTESLKKKLKKDINEEKGELKQVMHNEFGVFRNDSTIEQKPKTERQIKREQEKKKEEERKKRVEKQEEGKFIIEWEDE
ncbi:MAG: AsmA-like C-terminal region-containing protein [Bacteroidales bacterium]